MQHAARPDANDDEHRHPAIDVPSNRLVIHPLGRLLLPHAIRLKVHPNAVSLAGLGFGLLAASCFWNWQDPRMAVAGWVCLMAWLIMDGLDGALARALSLASPLGRFVDGFSDYGVFVVVTLALVMSIGPDPATLGLALAAGLAHAVQSAFYEAARATWFRRVRGQFSVSERIAAGGVVERLYNRMETILGNRVTRFDVACAAAEGAARIVLLSRWQRAAARRFAPLWLLSSNARAHAILLACLLGDPRLAWWWDLLALSTVALAGGRWWRGAEARALAVEGTGGAP
jgi:phosphatidylglycerophosphate synthase